MSRLKQHGFDLRSSWLILVACVSVSIVVAAMASLNIALADIAVDIGADTGQMTWIIDGYTLALAALLLPGGAIGDRFGRRGTLIVGLVLFAAASISAIWLTEPVQLIISRCVAGAAAALIMPATLSLITSGVPAKTRPMAISIWAAIVGAGAIAGFFVTGLLLEFFSWHSIFITFTISSVVMAALALTVGTSKDRDPGRFDFLGSATSVLGVTGVVFGLLEVSQRGWTDPLVLGSIIVGVVLLSLFCVIELRVTDKLLDVRLFTNRAFGAGSLAVGLQFFASFGIFYLFLLRLQLVFGYSPLQSAVALSPMVAGVVIFTLASNYIAVRFHSLRFVIAGGILICGIGILTLGVIDYDTYWRFAWMTAIAAVGIGLASAPSTTAIMANTPLDNQGVGSAVNDTARELGAAVGIALAGSILATGYSARITDTTDDVRRQLTAAGQQRIAAGDQAGGQALLAQASEISDRVGRSLAEATAVAERLPASASALSARIIDGAQSAFIVPMNHACIVLAIVLIAGAAFLAWYTPRRVVGIEEPLPDAQTPGPTVDEPAAGDRA